MRSAMIELKLVAGIGLGSLFPDVHLFRNGTKERNSNLLGMAMVRKGDSGPLWPNTHMTAPTLEPHAVVKRNGAK